MAALHIGVAVAVAVVGAHGIDDGLRHIDWIERQLDQSIMMPDEQVQAAREQRAQQAQAQQQMEMANQAADAVQKVSQAAGNADVTDAFSGYA